MSVEYIDHMGNVVVPRNKTHKRILEAIQRGYKITSTGCLTGPKGKITIALRGTQRYATFSTNWGGYVFGVPVHQFAAYCFFGARAFEKHIVVRHLNGNTLDNSINNIKLGSHSENNMDKPSEKRIYAAKKARAAQGVTPKNAKLTPAQVKMVREFYKKLNGRKAPNGSVTALSKQLGVHRVVLQYIKLGRSYASIV